jgi:hypothetical protein
VASTFETDPKEVRVARTKAVLTIMLRPWSCRRLWEERYVKVWWPPRSAVKNEILW